MKFTIYTLFFVTTLGACFYVTLLCFIVLMTLNTIMPWHSSRCLKKTERRSLICRSNQTYSWEEKNEKAMG